MSSSIHGGLDRIQAPLVLGIQVGKTRVMKATLNEHFPAWKSSFVKESTDNVWVGKVNLSGDSQTDVPNHGGDNRVILGYAATHYTTWESEIGVKFPYGAFAENFTISGLSENNACIGDVYEVGECLIRVSEPRIPCWKISSR